MGLDNKLLMTDIAVNNNGIIIKDGRIAELCSCCNGLCSNNREKATITLFGMSSSCVTDNLANREIEDDECSYTLFRIRSYDPNLCKYATVWHSSRNESVNFLERYANSIVLDLNANTLLLAMDSAYAVFTPPDGKKFRDSFPFDETLVCTSVSETYSQTCGVAGWQNLRVVIDDSTATYVPFVCPQDANLVAGGQTCSCDTATDTTRPAASTQTQTATSSTYTGTIRYPVFSCTPCDSLNYVDETTTTVTPLPCYDGNCVQSVSTTVAWPELIAHISIDGPNVDGYSYSFLSGTYALKYSNNARIGTPFINGLFFGPSKLFTSDPVSGLPFANGYGVPNESDRFAWADRNIRTQQGWILDYRTEWPGDSTQYPVGMQLVVSPVKTVATIDRNSKSVTTTKCPHGQFAYQVKFALFSHALYGVKSSLRYWQWDLSCYANVDCAARACGAPPSISLNSVETVFVPFSHNQLVQIGKLGQVTVGISS